MKFKVKEQKNGTCTIQLEMFEPIYVIFQNFKYLASGNICLHKRIHIHTHTQTQWETEGDDY